MRRRNRLDIRPAVNRDEIGNRSETGSIRTGRCRMYVRSPIAGRPISRCAIAANQRAGKRETVFASMRRALKRPSPCDGTPIHPKCCVLGFRHRRLRAVLMRSTDGSRKDEPSPKLDVCASEGGRCGNGHDVALECVRRIHVTLPFRGEGDRYIAEFRAVADRRAKTYAIFLERPEFRARSAVRSSGRNTSWRLVATPHGPVGA